MALVLGSRTPFPYPLHLIGRNATMVSQDERSKLGSKREIRPNVWQVRVSCGTRADGKRRVKSATVHGSAVEADAEIVRLAKRMGKCLTLGDSMSLDTYYWGYFSPAKHATVTKATAKTYDTHYRTHIAPHFGNWDMNAINNVVVQGWIWELPPKSARNYKKTFAAILNQAHADHLIEESPFAGQYRYKMPRTTNVPLPVWSADEVVRAIDALKGHQLYALWLVMVGAGLSRSEALALDWEDIRFESVLLFEPKRKKDGTPSKKKKVKVRHWNAFINVHQAFTGYDGMKEPKNDRRYRTVPMRPPFSDALHDCVGTGPICQSKKHTKDGYKLSGHRLAPTWIPKLWNELFKEGQPLEDFTKLGINRMRATYATMMQRSGVSDSIINAMQGRAQNSQVLYTNYEHPSMPTYERSADALTLLVGNG